MNVKRLRLALLVCLPVVLNGCGAEKSDAQSKSQQSTTTNTSVSEAGSVTENIKTETKNVTLSVVGANCKVRNASGNIVIYHNTIIPKSVVLSPDMPCRIAREMLDVAFGMGETMVKDFCEAADHLADRLGGGSYSRAITTISSWKQDNETKGGLKLLNSCKSSGSRLKLVKASVLDQNIFSVGTFENDGKACVGYLAEQMPQDDSGTLARNKIYELRGFKECKEFAINLQDANIFHPRHRPNGKRYGDYIVQSLKYDGEIPDYYNYKGEQYAFYNKE